MCIYYFYFYHTNQNVAWRPCALCISLFQSYKYKTLPTTFYSIVQIENVCGHMCPLMHFIIIVQIENVSDRMCTLIMHFIINIQIENVSDRICTLIMHFIIIVVSDHVYFMYYVTIIRSNRNCRRPCFISSTQMLEM